MGKVVRPSAPDAAILRDGGLTLAAATARGAPYQQDAEAFLKSTIDLLASLDGRIATAEGTEVTLRARQDTEVEKCDALVGRLSDELWNDIGRPASDPDFRQMFPAGVSGWTRTTPGKKPTNLQILAANVENTRHALISRERAAAVAAAIRAAAAALQAVNALLAPVQGEIRVLRSQRSAAVDSLQTQMARLKKTWRGRGMSEAQVHAIIPHRPSRTPFLEEVDAAATEPVVAEPAPALAVVEVPTAAK